MKSTGIVRKIDRLGRIVIPMEVRKAFDIDSRDPLEIFVEDEKIVMTKYTYGCIFCGSSKELKFFKDKKICASCSSSILK